MNDEVDIVLMLDSNSTIKLSFESILLSDTTSQIKVTKTNALKIVKNHSLDSIRAASQICLVDVV